MKTSAGSPLDPLPNRPCSHNVVGSLEYDAAPAWRRVVAWMVIWSPVVLGFVVPIVLMVAVGAPKGVSVFAFGGLLYASFYVGTKWEKSLARSGVTGALSLWVVGRAYRETCERCEK